MAKEQKSPQRKKQLEYTRDYISCGESVHGSRKTWALKKAFINREYRRKCDELLAQSKPGLPSDDANLAIGEVTAGHLEKSVSRKRLHKWTPITVARSIQSRLERRVESAGRRAAQRNKHSALVAEALGVLNSLRDDQLSATVLRAHSLCLSQDFKEKLKLKQSKDPIERAVHVFCSVCFGGRYLTGDGYLIDRIRREPELWSQFCLWVEKYERILGKEKRTIQRKA